MLHISFIILTWNSKKFLNKCFDSIIAQCASEGLNFEVVVIDNGSSDGSSEIFDCFERQYYEQFKFIRLNRNSGTTYSRNLGLKVANGKYLCILDSDTEFGDGCLREVFERLEGDDEVGIVAPRLLLPDNSVQNSVKKFPTFWHKISKIPQVVLGVQISDIDFYCNFPFTAEVVVDTAISACWFFKKELIEEIGYLDEKIFYSPEDLDYSVRVRKAGRSIVYFPLFTVLHHTQQITHRKPFSKVSLSHFSGLLYYFRKHGGWFSTREISRQLNSG